MKISHLIYKNNTLYILYFLDTLFGTHTTDDMVALHKKTMPNDSHLAQYKEFSSPDSPSLESTSSIYYDPSSVVYPSPSLPYLLFTVVVNLNALSLLPPKLDGQKLRHEIKGEPSGKYNKCHSNILKKKLKRNNRNENSFIQLTLQRHCAFFLVLLLVVVMMSFGDAGGIIDEPHYGSLSNRSERLFSHTMNEETESGSHGYQRNGYLGNNFAYLIMFI